MDDLTRSFSSASSISYSFTRSLSSPRLYSEETLAASPASLHDETFSDAKHAQNILARVQVKLLNSVDFC